MTDAVASRAGALLTVDLAAVQANYRRLKQELGGRDCAAAVKADAYGLGLARVAPALAAAGCRHFFVALPDEGLALRLILAEAAPKAEIYVLSGALPGSEADFQAHNLTPVINSLDDLDRWRTTAEAAGTALPAALHLDTGMSRLGLPPRELDALADDPGRLQGLTIKYAMSHLACADESNHALNQEQLDAFRAARARPSRPTIMAMLILR